MNWKQQKELDIRRLIESLAAWPEQIKSVWSEAGKIKLPDIYRKIDKVIVFGMGGSNLGARIIAAAFKKELRAPLIIEAGYEVPGFVDQNSLCVLSSYSGNTEEVLSVFATLIKSRRAKILAIGADTKNSALKKLAKKENILGLFFSTIANTSGQPRVGLGYSLFGLLALLLKAKILKINPADIKILINKELALKTKFSLDSKNNPAKKIAQKLSGRGVILLGGDFLAGNLHALRNQLNESSKNFSSYLVLPDMNHYALEGLSFPAAIKKNLIFLIFNSRLYHPRVRRRLGLTKKIIKKNKIKLLEYTLKEDNQLKQVIEMLQFGGWLSFYLGLSNSVNPSLTPWVGWFKKRIK